MTDVPRDWIDDDIILYDGVCVLCSTWIRFVAKRDDTKRFRFTPIESEYGSAMASALNIDAHDPDTNAVVIDGVALYLSDAAIAVLSTLPYWGWVKVLKITPRAFRDTVYTCIARNRYQWFGRHDVCDIGDASLSDRILLTYKPS